jgi:hypothetical protein
MSCILRHLPPDRFRFGLLSIRLPTALAYRFFATGGIFSAGGLFPCGPLRHWFRLYRRLSLHLGFCAIFPDSMILARKQLLRSLESPFGIYQSIKNGQHMAAVGDHSG